jgi:hypothetical protein
MVRFYYQDNKPRYQQEAIINRFTIAVSKVIELPPLIDVCLYDLGQNIYGGIDMYRINRVGINVNVPLEQIPKILTHELIHVHQKHIGVLKIKRDGSSYWHGVFITKEMPENMSFQDYENLPWELDVKHRLDQVFSDALAIVDK